LDQLFLTNTIIYILYIERRKITTSRDIEKYFSPNNTY